MLTLPLFFYFFFLLWSVCTDGGRNPNFNQILTFELREEPYVFEVEVYDNDPLKDDKLAHGL